MANTPQPPCFRKGHTVGDLTVVKPIVRSNYHPVTGAYLTKPQWWYQVVCACGNLEIRNQGSLRQAKGTAKCKACAQQTYLQKMQSAETTVEVPDFATMRLK